MTPTTNPYLEAMEQEDNELYLAIHRLFAIHLDYELFLSVMAEKIGATTEEEKTIIKKSCERMHEIYESIISFARSGAFRKFSDKQRAMIIGGYDKSVAFASDKVNGYKKSLELASTLTPLEGRLTVTGKITHTKEVTNDFGTTLKCMFLVNTGQKIWMTFPTGQKNVNEEIEVTVSVEQSPNDALFYFGKRPKLVVKK